MKISVVAFPGSHGVEELEHSLNWGWQIKCKQVWHQSDDLGSPDLLIIPGGSSFADYLRPGAIARMSRVCGEVRRLADHGTPILGIGNGFQILCEIGVLPGGFVVNQDCKFLNQSVFVQQLEDNTPFALVPEENQQNLLPVLRLPIACNFGCYFADSRTLIEMEQSQQITWRYTDSRGDYNEAEPFNNCTAAIAGVSNRKHNVLGIMVRPERSVDPDFGSTDGQTFFEGILGRV